MEERCSAGGVVPSLPHMPDTPPEPLRNRIPGDRLEAVRSTVRRAVLRRRRSLSALLAGLAVLAGIAAVAPPAAPTASVLVAVRDLASGEVLSAGDVERVAWPAGAVPGGAVEEVEGRTLAAPLRAGEPVTDVRLVGPGLAEAHPGRVVAPVRISDAGAVALLRVGDRVDVMAGDPVSPGSEAEVVASGATVLALPEPAGDASSYGPGGTSGALVVLAVEETAATRLLGSAVGGVLSLTISR